MKIGFIGLGTMGAPMAKHLRAAGHDLVVWNRTKAKTAPLVAEGAEAVETPLALAQICDVIILCVNRSEDVQDLVAKMMPVAKPGALFIDHSTIHPRVATEIHDELAKAGFGFVDAPITGGSMGANNGTLTIFCGGNEAEVARAKPILDAYAKRVERVGGPGMGQMMKMANQIAVGGALVALCESLAFAQKAGLDLEQAHELLKGGAAGSWAFDNYGPKILQQDWTPGFSIKNQRKDFGYCKEAAEDIGMDVPATNLVDQLLERLDNLGRGEQTTAALFDAYISGEELN
ncbi:MAG: NAD(P)-dependent oxidoreductase [Armatimonadetes bacterium]|nr:NAD(P)-dependent oxidoreductase [Armatimonadota bacterium]